MDGRSARRDRNRLAVVDAVIDILNEGALEMSIAEVTERSGVSERSIFRYFQSLDDLRSAVFVHGIANLASSFATDSPEEPRSTRIERLVGRRVALYEATPGIHRIARAREHEVPSIAAHVAEARKRLAAQVRQQFAPELGTLTRAQAAGLATVLVVLLSFSSWDLHTRVHGRSPAQVRRAWTQAIERLLPDHAQG